MITKERIETARARGFTLIEILIVVAIIAILASVVLIGLAPTQREGRDSRRISDLAEVQNGLELYYNHCGWYPGGAECGAWATTNDTVGTGGTNNAAYLAMGKALTGTTEIGVTVVPSDPTNSGSFGYWYGSTVLTSYTLATTLEDANNSALKSSIHLKSSNGLDCSASSTYCVSL